MQPSGKTTDPETIDALFAAFHGCRDEALYEQLVWLGLENAVYQRESPADWLCPPCGAAMPAGY